MDYKFTFEDGSSAYLAHHGVRGMKWGVWNEETKARHTKETRAEKKQRRVDEAAQKYVQNPTKRNASDLYENSTGLAFETKAGKEYNKHFGKGAAVGAAIGGTVGAAAGAAGGPFSAAGAGLIGSGWGAAAGLIASTASKKGRRSAENYEKEVQRIFGSAIEKASRDYGKDKIDSLFAETKQREKEQERKRASIHIHQQMLREQMMQNQIQQQMFQNHMHM